LFTYNSRFIGLEIVGFLKVGYESIVGNVAGVYPNGDRGVQRKKLFMAVVLMQIV
jgi:hypothetical protein